MPELKGRVAEDSNGKVTLARLDLAAVETVIPTKWGTEEETFHDTAKALLTMEKGLKVREMERYLEAAFWSSATTFLTFVSVVCP